MKRLFFIFIGFFVPIFFLKYAHGQWLKTENELICKDPSGNILQKIMLQHTEREISKNEFYTDKDFTVVEGSVTIDGQFAWVINHKIFWRNGEDFAQNQFQFLDFSGNVVWENKTVINVTPIADRKLLFCLESTTDAIQSMDFRDIPATPIIYGFNGNLVFKFSDCGTFDKFWELSGDGHYAYLSCVRPSPKKRDYIIYDLISRKNLKISDAQGNLVLNNDGSYEIRNTVQEKNTKTGMYEFKTKITKTGWVR